jgi:chemotaxis signal transduction protein
MKPRDDRRVLEERARALARPATAARGSEPELQLVGVRIGGESYAVEVRSAEAIEALPAVAPVPGLSPPWAGVVNLRGTLYPVVDAARLVGVEPQEPPERRRLVLVSGAGVVVALSVDGVAGITGVRTTDLHAAPPRDRGGPSPVRALTPDLVPVLDVNEVVAHASASLREGVEEAKR